ncbi:uncharacterized protein VP01_356g5 [Puccinia sorghi]|uniref:Uncharacterized protein n=1 Tax=Puccinia sorghi TaxID=27349 RepID=A0A0L6UW50_9BASI|nr:uncharacterized protein VP01_356g5 [Puccinia sorghi]
MVLYFDSETKAREWALRALRQTSWEHQDSLLRPVLGEGGGSGVLIITLISLYTQGLKDDIQLVLILGRIEFCTVAEVSNLALSIDAEINGNETAP